jgi:hypothetical protein
MRLRTLLTAAGAGITTAVLLTVLLIELLAVEFSMLLAVPIGVAVGLVVLAGLALGFDALSRPLQRVASGYAAFGLALLVQLASRYSNVGASRRLLSASVMVGLSLCAAVVVFGGLWLRERSGQPRQ